LDCALDFSGEARIFRLCTANFVGVPGKAAIGSILDCAPEFSGEARIFRLCAANLVGIPGKTTIGSIFCPKAGIQVQTPLYEGSRMGIP
jgi:hypothetical protein